MLSGYSGRASAKLPRGRLSIPPYLAGLEDGPSRCRIYLTCSTTTTNSIIAPARPTMCVCGAYVAGFAGYTVQACTSLAINDYMTTMQREGRKAPTINREIAVLRSAFRLGYHHDLITKVPAIKLLPELAVRNEFFTWAEIDVLLPCLPGYLRDTVLFAFLTGWRRGEIIGLQWTNVNRSGGVIRLEPEQNKSRTVRVLALRGKLAALIERRWNARDAERTLARHVFHRAGHQLKDFRHPWLAACRQAGLGHRLFHSLRRSAARNMSLQGVPEKVIMSIMGHKTRVMFDRYNIVTEADQGAYMDRLFG